MAFYVMFSLACALLGLIYLNKGRGSSRLYPSIAAVGVFLLFMWAISVKGGYDFQAAMTACVASFICGAIAYLLALLVQTLWHKGTAGKAVAVIACVAGCYLSVPVLVLGRVVHSIFRKQFDAADAEAAARRAEREADIREEERRREEREREILQDIHSDDELCTFFADLYRRMGYAPQLSRVGEEGPLTMFLDKDGNTFSFVAICRQEMLGPQEVEWASAFRGQAEKAGLVTLGTFSSAAVKKAKQLHVALVDRPNLPRFVNAARREERKRAFGIGDGT